MNINCPKCGKLITAHNCDEAKKCSNKLEVEIKTALKASNICDKLKRKIRICGFLTEHIRNLVKRGIN